MGGRKKKDGGKNIIPRLAKDLAAQFPQMKGLSPRNLGYMKAFAEAWPNEAILQQAVAKLAWFHNCIILDKIKTAEERLWYINGAIENGWSGLLLDSGASIGFEPLHFARILVAQ